ncbi:hypothetical protein BSNK01_10850 [Bacillaceae bacterium]
MMGFLFSERECQELRYLLRRELEEMLLDLEDERLDGVVRQAIADRYSVVFRMFARLASPAEKVKYMKVRTK